jgi:hypothetical protein
MPGARHLQKTSGKKQPQTTGKQQQTKAGPVKKRSRLFL